MSREAELYKDKIEVSLDGRQIFYLFFGGAVIVGLVFVLGVMVGRRVEARGHIDRARVAATVDPLAALDRLEGGGGLSFQGALRGGDAPASDVEKTIAALPKLEPADKKGAPAAKAEPKKVDAAAEPAGKGESAKTGTAKVDVAKADGARSEAGKGEGSKGEGKGEGGKGEGKGESKPDAAKIDGAKLDAKVEGAKSGGKADTAKAETTAKSGGKAEDTKAEATAKAAGKPEGGKAEGGSADAARPEGAEKKPRYTLQLSAFQDRHEALAYLDAIKSSGYQAYVTEGAVDGKQFFRVRMGSYRTIDAANAAKAEFEQAAKRTAIVTKL